MSTILPLKILTIERQKDCALCRLSLGELNLTEDAADAIGLELQDLANQGVRTFIIDLNHAGYVTTAMFNRLLALRRRLKDDGDNAGIKDPVTLINVAPGVLEVLTITALNKVLPVANLPGVR